MKDSEGGTGKEPRTEKWDVKSGFLKRLRPFHCPRRASTPAEVATLPLKTTIIDNPNLPNYQAKKRNRGNTPVQQEETSARGRSVKRKEMYNVGVLEEWMENEISFRSIRRCLLVDSLIILEALIEGFQVRRIYVDGGSSSEVMYEHCFKNLGSDMKAKLRESRVSLVGFSREVNYPLGNENEKLGGRITYNLLDDKVSNGQRDREHGNPRRNSPRVPKD
ncbi:hypothetical protein Tco_0903098 [Tanacetum coccineum]